MSSSRNMNAYETGCQPFEPDLHRGKWPSRWTFYLIAVSQGFVIWHFYLSYYISYGGVLFVIPYLISMFLFIVPIIFIQSSLGQFSSTGYISVFRIAPLFKGVTFIIFLLNISCAIIYSVYTAYPLIYFLLSVTSNFPWLTCNNSWNSPNCTEVQRSSMPGRLWESNIKIYEFWSTNEYFENVVLNNMESKDLRIAPYVVAATFLVWTLVALATFNGIKSISKAIMVTGSVPLIILLILLLRISFLPKALGAYQKLFSIDTKPLSEFHFWIMSSSLMILSLGAGWGGTLTLASFNDFKENTTHYSLLISGCHFLITIFTTIFSFIIVECKRGDIFIHYHYYYDQHIKYLFVPYPYVFRSLEAQRLWMILFYLMLFLIQFNNVVIQVFATLTSLFDEYKILRLYKRRVSVGGCALLFLASMLFATNNINDFFELWHQYGSLTRSGICLVELFIVFWVYGRSRFQRDIQFMLSQRIPSWIFFVIRFVTPLFMIYLMYLQIFNFENSTDFEVPDWGVVLLYMVKIVPWILIPIYIVYQLISTTGPLILRIKRSIRPTDWYPADARNHQNYQDLLDASDTTQQLLEFTCDLEDDSYDCQFMN